MAKSDAPKVKLRTVDKRFAGTRARETRERILEALAKLLSSMSYRNVRVTDVVREVGTSPATFYQYFADVETAVLALAQDVAKDASSLKTLGGGGAWSGKAGSAAADALIDGVGTFFKANEAVLRVIDIAAQEGDKRFQKVRATVLGHIAAPLQAAAGNSKEAKANAAAAASLIANAAANRGGEVGTTAADMRAAVHRLVHWSVTGRKPTG